MRCEECGCFLLGAEQGGHTYYPSASDDAIHYCRACWGRRQRGIQRHSVFLAAVVLIGGLGVASLGSFGRETHLARVALLLLVTYFVSTILHELGHAGVARFFGLKVFKISFGAGHPLWARSVAGVSLEFCSYPTSGFVQHAPGTPAQSLLVTLGGPLANLFLLAIGWSVGIGLQAPPPVPVEQVTPWHALVVVNLLILAYNVIPFEFPARSIDEGDPCVGVPNDGLSILRQLRGSESGQPRADDHDG